ncbi:MAG: hypothetical protein K0B11_18100 [Mariniphaga sp.]|nr:hypothetical protein [Mariniphaga sp.]
METKFDMNQWGYIKDKLQDKYPDLTNADLFWGRVSRNDLLEMISNKLGKTQKEIINVIDSF